ncbi:MAG: hypothetical protein ACK5PB_20770, partial [Pirellula sp.]
MTKVPKQELNQKPGWGTGTAISFWKRIESWFDRFFRLTTPLDPNEVDGVLLEDRILYSATPLAFLDGGE